MPKPVAPASCGVFEGFSAAAEAGARIDRLVLGLPTAFAPLKMEFIESEEAKTRWVRQSYTAHLKVPGLRPQQKTPGQLALHFDLSRPDDPEAGWPWARHALVVVAYGLVYDQGWTGAQLTVRAEGQLGYEELERLADGRFKTTGAPASGRWADCEWAYAVPFASLDGAGALRTQIVDPVTALLLLGQTPDQALAATSAVAWSRNAPI